MLDLTIEDIESDWWAHHYFENPTSESGEDEDWDTDEVLALMESDDWEDVILDRD